MSSALTMSLDDREVGELAGARRVEVDDVQRLRALVLPVARQFHRVVAEHGDVVEVAAPQAHRLAGLDVDGGEHDHDVGLPVDVGDEPRQQGEPDARTLLRVELYRPDVVARYCRHDGTAVVGRRGDHGRVGGDGRVGVHEVDGGRGRQPARHARAGRPPVQVVPADVRHLEAGLQTLDGAARARRGPASGRPRRCSRRAAGGRGRRRGTAYRPRSARARRPPGRSAEPRGRVAERADAGQTTPAAPAISAALCVTRTSAPLRASALATLARLPMP